MLESERGAGARGAALGRRSKLSAVVCCYRDAEALTPMYERLSAVFASLPVDYEIIFVDDASPDDADSVLAKLTKDDARVIAVRHSRNFGSQSAFSSGMLLATGDAVILLDGDLQDPPELISAFHGKWLEGNEVVYGRRVKRRGAPLLGLFAKLFYRILRRTAFTPIPLDAGDFALMDRRVVDELLALPETDQFLRGLRAWVGFTQTGVDYVRPERPFGRSTHSWFKNFWWARKGFYSFTFVPLEVLFYLGAALTTLSLCALLSCGALWFARPDVPLGLATLVSVVAFFGSLNLLAVAVVGEYVLKVVEEAKRRPKFIRKAIRCHEGHLTTARAIDDFVARRRCAAARTADDVDGRKTTIDDHRPTAVDVDGRPTETDGR